MNFHDMVVDKPIGRTGVGGALVSEGVGISMTSSGPVPAPEVLHGSPQPTVRHETVVTEKRESLLSHEDREG